MFHPARVILFEPGADPGDEPGCVAPSIDAANLGSFGCELWTHMCIDQVRTVNYCCRCIESFHDGRSVSWC